MRTLRDRLATETPKARARPHTPPALAERLREALALVSDVYLRSATAARSDAFTQEQDDALVEGHLALHDWERHVASDREPRPAAKAPWASNRRQHERVPAGLSVKLRRPDVRESDAALALRPARNVSLGGIFVGLAREDRPDLGVGTVVHVIVTGADGKSTHDLRATVVRRDESGLGLHWIVDSDRARRTIESLLDAVRKLSPPRG